VNEAFCTFFETTQQAACADGYRVQDLMNASDAERLADRYRTTAARGLPFVDDVRVRRGDGAIRWMEVHLQPQTGAGGAMTGLVGTASDITERRRAAEELRSEAAVIAFRARLTDTLAEASTALEAQQIASRQLAERLSGPRAHFAEIDETGEFGSVKVASSSEVPDVVGTHHLFTFGPRLMSELRDGRTAIVNDVAHDSRLFDQEQQATLALGIAAHIMVPIMRDDRTVAGLFVHHTVPHDWTDEEVAVAKETALRGWAAVDRARRNVALQRGQERAQLLSELIADLETRPTVQSQLEVLVQSLVPRIADYATVESPGSEAPLLQAAHRDPVGLKALRALRSQHRVDASDSNSVSRAAAGEPQLISVISPAVHASYAAEPSRAELLARLSPRSHIAVPLDLGNGVNGALMVGLSDPDRDSFNADDLSFLREVALRTGIVLAASRIREQEHEISVRLQQALLPDSIVWHPSFLVEARYQAASSLMEVGGHWYDTFSWPNGHIGVMVGDVVGHNIESAATMGRLRWATAASAAYVDPTPASLLGALDRAALGPSDSAFATAVCAIVDPESGRLTYSAAGHPPIVVVAPDGSYDFLTEATGMPVCALASGARPESSKLLEPGSLVVLYSDGLVERRDRNIDVGIEHLANLASKYVSMPLAFVADRLLAELSGDDSPSEDDIVVVCCRYTPVVAEFHRTIPSSTAAIAGLRNELIPWLTERGIATMSIRRPVRCTLRSHITVNT
jgi:PAS domain S-box-containing protein